MLKKLTKSNKRMNLLVCRLTIVIEKSEIRISRSETNSKFQNSNFSNFYLFRAFGIWSFKIVSNFACLPQAGISCFEFRPPCKRNYIEEIGYMSVWDRVRIIPLSSDKWVVSLLVLDGGGRGRAIIVAGVDDRISWQYVELIPNGCFQYPP
jgi:hypothetical protein